MIGNFYPSMMQVHRSCVSARVSTRVSARVSARVRVPLRHRPRFGCRACMGGFQLPESVVTSYIATLSKVVSYLFTYPLETSKLYSQMGETITTPSILYQGFGIFVLTAAIQCYINYNIFFACIQYLSVHHQKHVAIFYASFISCFITSFIRVPMSFISRNIVFVHDHTSGFDAVHAIMRHFTLDMYKKGWLINMLCDVPDSFIKFFLNSYLGTMFPMVGALSRSTLTGIITCIINTPLDYMVTKTLCYADEKRDAFKHNDCMSGLEYRVMSSIVGNVVFFYIFNSLRACFQGCIASSLKGI